MKNTKNKVIAMLCIAVCIMSIGYAAFSTTLSIEGTSNITSEWKVVFTKIQALSKSESIKINEEKIEGTTATFDIELNSPGDEIIYEITVENQGTVDAVIEDIKATETGNEAIIFEISNIKKGDTLGKKSSTTFNVKIKYNSNVTTQPEILDNKLTIDITYVQNLGQVINGSDGSGVTPPAVNLISFTVEGVIYQAEEGMSWEEWINSKYNTGGYKICTKTVGGAPCPLVHGVIDTQPNMYVAGIYDIIVANKEYNAELGFNHDEEHYFPEPEI